MSFNITVRADSRKQLLEEIEEQGKDLPAAIRKAINDIVAIVPEPKGGYTQLTTYGHVDKTGPCEVVFHLNTNLNQ